MICDECGQDNATINVIDMVGGKKSERMLCEACYGSSDISEPFSETEVQKNEWLKTLDELNHPSITPEQIRTEIQSDIRCDVCNYSLTEFQKNGRVRCAMDYETFTPRIDSLLKNLHGAAVHTGSTPQRIKDQMVRTHRISQLENELGIAIHEEDYEGAAALRDRINTLRIGEDMTQDD